MRPINRRRISYTLCLLLSLAAAAAPTGPERGPTFAFGIPRTELMATIKTVGVMPLAVAAEVPDAAGVTARYESEIVARLTSAGFSVIPPSVMREIRERTKATLGGLYDPMTGDPIKERVDALNAFSVNEYRATNRVDAILEPAIILRSTPFGFNYLTWDGVGDSVTGESAWADFWKPSESMHGEVPTLSLIVRLVDASGKPLYTGVGGLQVLGYWKNTATWRLKERLLRIDPKYVMTDPARDARALSLALDPLLQGRVSKSPKVTTLPAPTLAIGAAPKVSREELLAHFPRLALASLDLEQIRQGDRVRLRYREALTQKLTQLGFEVVNGDDYNRLWDAERTAAGGYFDAFTGRLDEARFKAARLRVLRSMQEHVVATAIVIPRVIVRAAPYSSGSAEWDGIKESLTGKNGFVSSLLLDPTNRYSGSLSAVSLEVQIIDPAGEVLLEGYGGIQLTERFNPAGPEQLAESELFADPARDTRAIEIALAPLVAPAPTTRP